MWLGIGLNPGINVKRGSAAQFYQNSHDKEFMGDNQLNWFWFDPLQCWADLYEWWSESGMKDHLMHHSKVRHIANEEGKDQISVGARGSEETMGWIRPELLWNPELRSRLNKSF